MPNNPVSEYQKNLRRFVAESNKIEGKLDGPSKREIDAHKDFLANPKPDSLAVCRFVKDVAGAPLRGSPGMNVRVGNHRPISGGPEVAERLKEIILRVTELKVDPWKIHNEYETLHPFMDGNGRSGRALWLWQMIYQGNDPYALRRGFLHSFYYQTLSGVRRDATCPFLAIPCPPSDQKA